MLAFFAASDGIVLENLAVRFMKEIQIPEVSIGSINTGIMKFEYGLQSSVRIAFDQYLCSLERT